MRKVSGSSRSRAWHVDLSLAQLVETEPFRQDWLALTPAQRMLRSWRMRRLLKDPQEAHDALSLPRL